jgi:hypothetical protein
MTKPTVKSLTADLAALAERVEHLEGAIQVLRRADADNAFDVETLRHKLAIMASGIEDQDTHKVLQEHEAYAARQVQLRGFPMHDFVTAGHNGLAWVTGAIQEIDGEARIEIMAMDGPFAELRGRVFTGPTAQDAVETARLVIEPLARKVVGGGEDG